MLVINSYYLGSNNQNFKICGVTCIGWLTVLEGFSQKLFIIGLETENNFIPCLEPLIMVVGRHSLLGKMFLKLHAVFSSTAIPNIILKTLGMWILISSVNR